MHRDNINIPVSEFIDVLNEEKEKGSIEKGKSADFIILNQNIMEIDPKKIPYTKVLKTFIDGELVYQNEDL